MTNLNFRSFAVSALVISLVFPYTGVVLAARNKKADVPHVAGEIIVKFKPGVLSVQQFSNKHRLQSLNKLLNQTDGSGELDRLHIARVSEQSIDSVLAELNRDPNVEYAEPNYIVTVSVIPNDPGFPQLWAMNNTGQTGGTVNADVDAPQAWDFTTGTNLVVGVIDTGIDYNHPDLVDNIWTNPGEIAGNGIDDESNGFIDDIHGWDFVNNDNAPLDDHGHGTHVAGTISAKGNNGIGVAGVNWTGKVAGLKFLAANGSGSIANALKALQYANTMGFKITNNSWGGGGFSQAFFDELNVTNSAGNLFVAAAGNNANNNDIAPSYPASYIAPNVVSVAATDHNDLLATFSNYGATAVDLGAPGVNIYSTVPTGVCQLCNSTGYLSISGTSMASPHVAGAAALLWSNRPTLSNLAVKTILMASGNPISSLSGKTASGNRLNLNNMFEEDTTAPSAVTDLTVQDKSASSVTLSWTATGDDGVTGKASSYDVRYSLNPIDSANFSLAQLAVLEPSPGNPGTVQTFSVAGLNESSTYYFALKVVDNMGNTSEVSNTVSETTLALVGLFSDNMENGTNGWVVTGQSNNSGGASLWHQSQRRSSSPTTSWYYGKESTGNYDTGFGNFGAITSPEIDLTDAQNPFLTFDHFLTTENSPVFDIASVYVVNINTGVYTEVLRRMGTANAWFRENVSLTNFQGSRIKIIFSFNTVDAFANNPEGWYIDNVAVSAASAPAPTPTPVPTPTPAPIPNELPVADAGSDQTGPEREIIVLDGSLSSDVDGDIVSYIWEFGDGTSAGGATVVHTYNTAGSYVATLTVTDDRGGVASDTANVTITPVPNQPPVANAGPDKIARAYEVNLFDGSASTDLDGTIVSYVWDFGDGVSLIGQTINHKYVNPGSYVATLTVTDNDGAVSIDTLNVTINPAVPLVIFNEGFETNSWTSNFSQDTQNDWSRNGGTAFVGVNSIRFSGPGTNSALTARNVVNFERIRASVYFSWRMTADMDLNEYIAMDVSTDNGVTWTEKARLRGNVDPEGVWSSKKIDLDNVATVRVRFRGLSNQSNERGFVDAVRIESY